MKQVRFIPAVLTFALVSLSRVFFADADGAPGTAKHVHQKPIANTTTRAEEAEPILTPIFNGKDLTGFRVPDPNLWWSVHDGILVGTSNAAKQGSMLWTQKLYQDVIVDVEFRFTGNIDSGVMLRKPEIQAQIGVSVSLKKDMTASIYAHGKYPKPATGVNKLLKVGDWNTMRFQAKGSTYDVWLNGEHVLNYEDTAFPNPAPIGLQIHPNVAMKIEFRSIKAAALNEVPATATWTSDQPAKKVKKGPSK